MTTYVTVGFDLWGSPTVRDLRRLITFAEQHGITDDEPLDIQFDHLDQPSTVELSAPERRKAAGKRRVQS